MEVTYFVHSTTTDNENGVSTGQNPGTLSRKGVLQSKELARLLSKRGDEFDAIYSSDLKRAVDAARMFFPGKTIIEDARLRELDYGTLNGGPAEIVEKLAPYCADFPFPGGESYKDCELRILSFLKQAAFKHPKGRIAIVAHKAPQLALDVICRKLSWKDAFRKDWRLAGKWKPGWKYEYP